MPIPIVEDSIKENINHRLKLLQANPDAISRILSLKGERLSRIIRYISESEINIRNGYPITPAELPCVCVLLSEEDEEQEGLGDTGFDGGEVVDTSEEVLVVLTDTGYLAQLSKPQISAIHSVYHRDSGTYLEDYRLDPNRSRIELYDPILDEGDSIVVSLACQEQVQETVRTMYSAEYRIEVWTDNGDLTVDLYHLIKWAMLSGRDFLIEEKDLYRQKLSGGDFEPVTSFMPTFVYRRALNFWCQFSVDPIENIGDEELFLITDIHTTQHYYEEDGSNE